MADETASSTSAASGQPRPGYRGKCLYKTGKCNNERALKTSGQSHNLCDEHRHRQNEHQRKLDAKNRFARKDKRSGSVKGDSPTSGAAMAAAAVSRAAAHGHRYMPYGKVRMSPNAAAAVAGVDDVHAILGRNGIVPQPMMQFHALGIEGANAMAAAASQMAANGGTSGVPAGSPEILPSGVVILPNGPQAPQMPYPSAMQDFDGIVVPLPSYLEGHERVEFRSRIYQKVLDFIAEECMRRFGAVGPTGSAAAPPPMQPSMVNAMTGAAAAATTAVTGDRREESSNGAGTAVAIPIPTTPEDVQTASSSQTNAPDSQDTTSEKKVADNDKDEGDDTQPENADEEHSGDEEEEEAPRSKRATRSRVVRKDSQTI